MAADGAPAHLGLGARKRQSIKSVALATFVERGFAATSIEDIAAAAGVSRQTVYNQFGGKEELFLEVVDEAIVVQLAQLRAATDTYPKPPVDIENYLLGLGRRIVAVYLHPRAEALRTLIQSELPRHPALRDLWHQRAATPVWSTMIGNLARLAHAGHLTIDDPVRTAGQYVTLVTGSAWNMTPMGTFAITDRSHDTTREEMLAANVHLFVAAHSRSAPPHPKPSR